MFLNIQKSPKKLPLPSKRTWLWGLISLSIISIVMIATILFPALRFSVYTLTTVRAGMSLSEQELWVKHAAEIAPKFIHSKMTFTEAVVSYVDHYDGIVSEWVIPLPQLSYKIKEVTEVVVPFEKQETVDTNLILGGEYMMQNGADGTKEVRLVEVVKGEDSVLQASVERLTEPAVPQIVAKGVKDVDIARVEAELTYELFIDAMISGNFSVASRHSDAGGELLGKIRPHYQTRMSYLGASSFKQAIGKYNSDTDSVSVGLVATNQEHCKRTLDWQMTYFVKDQRIKIDYPEFSLSQICIPNDAGLQASEVVKLLCKDCWLAPVDKVHELPDGYTPELRDLVGVPDGGKMSPEAATQVEKMVVAAKKVGIAMRSASAYRSEDDQKSTFTYWVNLEKSRGLSQAEAERSANRYSARPGHSEHQLGTTVDISCVGCSTFGEPEKHKKLYEYLKHNAHLFGFIVSYPEGLTDRTGYNHEPWHVRYIGVELATELFNKGYASGNGYYLAAFLIEKGLF